MSDSKTILLVDDDAEVIRGMSLRFRAAGYQTITADSAASGLRAARHEHPSAIVMDVRMDDRDGIEALEELKEDRQTKSIPIVMLSACINAQQRALDKGARFFIRKPYYGRDVVTAVESALHEADQQPSSELP